MWTARRTHAPANARTHFDALEPRAMLDATFNGTDSDGDLYTVTLKGAGTIDVLTTGGGQLGSIDALTISGSDAATKVSISVKRAGGGNGRVSLQTLTASPLDSFAAPSVDVVDGSLAFERVASLVLGDVLGGGSITDSSPDSLDQTAAFRRLSTPGIGNLDVTFGGLVKKFTAVEWTGPGTLRAAGIGELKITGSRSLSSAGHFEAALSLSENARATPLLKKATIAGDITRTWEIIGGAGSISVNNVQADADLNIDGPLGTLNVKGTLLGDVRAITIGTINVKGAWSSEVSFTGADVRGVGLGTFKVGQSPIGFLNSGMGDGRVGTLESAGDLTAEISVRALTTLKVKGFANLGLVLSGQAGQPALKSATIGGKARGEWDLAGDLGSLSVGGMSSDFDLSLTGDALSISSKGAVQGTLGARSFKSITAKTTMLADMIVSGENAQGVSVGSISVGGQALISFTEMTGSVGSVKAGGAQLIMGAERIGSITITGKNGGDGRLANSTIVTTGADSQGLSIGSVGVAGDIEGCTIAAKSDLKSITAKRIIGSNITAGVGGGVPGLPADLGFLDDALPANRGVIGSIKVTQKFDLGVLAFNTTLVAARIINGVSIVGRTGDANSGEIFGFAADTIKKIALRTNVNNQVTLSNLTNPEELSPLGATDFRVRVL